MATLLEKTRKINRLLQSEASVSNEDIASVLSSVLTANVYIVSREGKILGHAFVDDFECDLMVEKVLSKGAFPKPYVNFLLKQGETSANRRSKTGKCAYKEDAKCQFDGKNTTIVPIYGVGERIGTLVAAKYDEEFDEDDLILAEYSAAVVGMELLREKKGAEDQEAMRRVTVETVLSTLSYSEREAAVRIFEELEAENEGFEGILTASKIANPEDDSEGESKISHTVIVNALRKFESAGVIESRSLGRKGTYIKVLNEFLPEEIKKLKR